VAYGIEDIKASGLRGDVPGRVTEVKVGRKLSAPGLGTHASAAVWQKLIRHDAIKAGERSDGVRRDLQQLFQRRGCAALQSLDALLHEIGVMCCGRDVRRL
jgi:hypothetical protein